jgi:hypothetical protein
LAAGNYSVHSFYAEVLNLLNVSADLVYPALNNALLVSTGLGTVGLGLGHVGLGLGLLVWVSASVSVQSVSVLALVSADPVLITSLVVNFLGKLVLNILLDSTYLASLNCDRRWT